MSSPNNDPAYQTRHSLLERVRDPNDKKAWEEFVGYYEDFIYNLLIHIQVPSSDAEEVSQEIILRLWKKLPEFNYDKDKGKFRNWLHTMIRNEASRYFTKNNKKNKFFHSENHEVIDQAGNSHDYSEIDKFIDEEWEQHVSNLAWMSIKQNFSDKMQKVFLLYSSGTSYKEISKDCDITEVSARVYINRMRNHLESEIDKFKEELF